MQYATSIWSTASALVRVNFLLLKKAVHTSHNYSITLPDQFLIWKECTFEKKAFLGVSHRKQIYLH